MEIVILLVFVALAVTVYFNLKKPDTPSVLDLNKDGQINAKDAVIAVAKIEEAVVTEVKAVATKAKTAVKKTVAKKAPAKKAPAKRAAKTAKKPAVRK